VRNVRRDGMETLKTHEKKGRLSQDEQKREEQVVQKATDRTIAEVEAAASPRRRKSWPSDPGRALRLRVGQRDAQAQAPDREGPVTGGPRHVGIIMDGNGRWAKARMLPRVAGHRAGVEAVRRVCARRRAWGCRR
jgi:hypothetical protein